MIARQIILCGELEWQPLVDELVARSIEASTVRTSSGKLEDDLAGARTVDAIVLAPVPKAAASSGDPLKDIADTLTSMFANLKAAMSSFEEHGVPGRIISLLPSHRAMGDPDDVGGSAVSGAMLSLFRTVSLELRNTNTTANTLMYSTDERGGLSDPKAIAALMEAILYVGSNGLNGQEIFAAGAVDVGRLHP